MSDYATIFIHDALCYPNPALKNPALARCCKLWKRAYRAKYRSTESERDASDKASAAFRAALPPLTTPDDCRDFITCVAYGMLIKAITEKDGGKLLYAAQIALSSHRNESNSAKIGSKMPASAHVRTKNSQVRPEESTNGQEKA